MSLALSSRTEYRVARTVTLFLLIVLSTLLFTSCTPAPPLDEAFITSAEHGLSPQTLSGVLIAQEQLRKTPENTTAGFALAYLYLQALRENADTEYYRRAEIVLQTIEQTDPDSPEIPFLRGSIAAGKHDFPKALAVAKKLVAMHPATPRYYGLLVDALVEMGQYDEAVAALQTMVDLRPDYSSYSRVAYLREIHGDVPGAIEGMQQAVEAGTGIRENTAWALSEYARLLLPSKPAEAKALYERALLTYPDFPAALAGLAKVSMAQGKTAEAKATMENVLDILPLPEHAAFLGDIWLAEGQSEKANVYFKLVEIGYDQIAASGTNVELERTKFLLEHNRQMESIVEKARAIYADRPTIYAADTLAWALHKASNTKEALHYSAQALRTESQDPMLLFHAGMIERAAGKNAEAKAHLSSVAKESPFFSFLHKPELEKALREL